MSDNDLSTMGPIDYLVVEFPGNKMTGEGIPILLDLVERKIIRIIDLGFIQKHADGRVSALKIKDLDVEGAEEFVVFEGASSGLLSSDEFDEAASAIEPGSAAGILVYENLWAAPLGQAWRRGGAQLVASGRIQVQAILAALGPDD